MDISHRGLRVAVQVTRAARAARGRGCQRAGLDCDGSHAGLFCGVLVIVFTITSIILSSVFSADLATADLTTADLATPDLTTPDLTASPELGGLVRSVSSLVLYTVATLAVLVGTCQIRCVDIYISSLDIYLSIYLSI